MRVLIDTCVIVDVLQNREPFSVDAQAILLASANKRFDGFISAKAVADIYYLTHKLLHNDKETRIILRRLFVLFEVLDITGMDCKRAIASDTVDYEDAVMIETAVRSGIDCIVTRNIRDYTASTLLVFTPADFLKELNTEGEIEILE